KGQRDWRPPCAWLEHAVHGTAGCAVLHYMLGLSYWQGNDLPKAEKCFSACLSDEPPVLSPGAYYLCLHLDDAAVDRLRDVFGPRDTTVCLEALEQRLANWGDSALYRRFR